MGQATTLQALGDLLAGQGEVQEAFERWVKAGELFDAIGARLGQANVMLSIGRVLIQAEQAREQGRAMLEGALETYRAIGDRSGEANVGIELAGDAERRGDLRAAIGYLEPVVMFAAAIGHPLEKVHRGRIEAWRREIGEG